MPLTYQRGKIRFESQPINNEDGRMIVMFEIECTPPVTGSERKFNYEQTIGPYFEQRFMQKHEMPAMLEGAKLSGETLDSAKLLEDLSNNFDFKSLDIDESNLPPEWQQTVSCYKVSVGYIITYAITEIRAVSTEFFSVNNDQYPKDETIATFRIYTPKQCRFQRTYHWNPECCPGISPVPKSTDATAKFPTILWYKLPYNYNKYGWGIELRLPFEHRHEEYEGR